MSGEKNTSPTHRAYAITNIKTYVPLILDLTTRNYDPWRDLFTAHCIAYDVLDHIDDSYDAPNKPPTDPEWEKLDAMVKLWLFGSISQSLITSVHSSNATARRIWLNIDALFCENKDATALQLESELRTISMGDLSVHDYCTKVKKIADLLEGLGEKVKEKHVVIHAINGLSSKFDGVANIIRHSKPFPTFSEMRSMLGVEEQRLLSTRVPSPSHDHHSSAPSLLHVGNSSSNRGGGNNNNFRRNDRRGGHNNFNRRRQSQPNTTGAPPSRNNNYGWVYFPPPTHTRHHSWAVPTQQQQPQPTSSWGRPNSTSTGLLGPRPQPAHSTADNRPQAYVQPSNSDQPPWAWLGTPDQPTSLPSMFNTMTLSDPGNGGWVMDTGATDHVHATQVS